jgi:hypothetical protein
MVPVLDLARAPRRAARKKGSGYENGELMRSHPRPQAQARAALTVVMECCGWERNAR